MNHIVIRDDQFYEIGRGGEVFEYVFTFNPEDNKVIVEGNSEDLLLMMGTLEDAREWLQATADEKADEVRYTPQN